MVCQWPARPVLLFDREEKLRLLASSNRSVLIQPATHTLEVEFANSYPSSGQHHNLGALGGSLQAPL